IEAAKRSFPAGEMPSLIVTFLNPTNGDVCFETDTALNRTVMRGNLHFDLSWTPLRLHKGIQDRIANPPLSIRGMYAPTFAAPHGKEQAIISANSFFEPGSVRSGSYRIPYRLYYSYDSTDPVTGVSEFQDPKTKVLHLRNGESRGVIVFEVED